jgi:hypothetical protein
MIWRKLFGTEREPIAAPLVVDEAPVAAYSADTPISAPSEDRFGRSAFAERIAFTLAGHRDRSSLVVGIYGKWGEGKTSVLHLMQQALADRRGVVVASFNPWRFKSEEDLLLGFFQTLAAAVGASLPTGKERFGELLGEYGFILSGAASAATLGALDLSGSVEKIVEKLSSSSLEERKARIEELLEKAGLRVVVIIDDIDRLDRAEIQAIFKLVKLSAQFRSISYILAFDDEVVAQSLGEKYGSGDTEAGRRFIEKIVQVPLRLPRADQIQLRRLTFDGIQAALDECGIQLSQDAVNVFSRYFIDCFDDVLTTPRHAKLYGNSVLFALPLLKGEVDMADLLLLEAIRVFYPRLHEVIARNEALFAGSSRNERTPEGTDPVDALVDKALEEHPASLRSRVRSRLLGHLFPRVGSMTYGSEWEVRWANEQRACSSQYFSRYFSYGVFARDVSDQDVARFISAAGAEDSGQMEQVWSRAVQGGAIEQLVRKLRHREDKMPADKAIAIALFVAHHAEQLPKRDSEPFNFTGMQPAILVRKLLMNVQKPEERLSAAKTVLEQCSSLSYAGEIFRWMRTEDKEPDEERLMSQADEQQLGGVLAARIAAHASEGPLYKLESDCPLLFYIWRKYGDPSEAADHLAESLKQNPENASALIECYVGRAWSMETGIPHAADFSREGYNNVAELVDPAMVVEALVAAFGDIGADDFHAKDDADPVLMHAHQFAWIHRKVLGEDAKVPPKT